MIINFFKLFVPLALIGLIGWNLYPGNTELQTKKQLDEIETRAQQAAEKRDIDTDDDGLFDWEEDLYKTDPENSDTDNDGVSDKDEVDQNRSPVVFGSGLTEDLKDLVAQKNIAESNLEVPQNLGDVEITGQIESLSSLLEKNGYTNQIDGLKNNQSEEQIEMKNYFNKVADQILLAGEDSGTLDKNLFSVYEGKADDEDRRVLRSLAFRYKVIGEGLAELETPALVTVGQSNILSEKYLELSSSFYELINSEGSYGNNEFKVKADLYTKNVTERNTMFVDIHKFVKKEKIYFSESDSGRFFLFEIRGEI